MPYTAEIQQEYQSLWDSCVPSEKKAAAIEQRVQLVLAGKPKYQEVAGAFGCPWAFVGVIHSMEADCRFDRHLHNGDPLTARTVQEPAGRPPTGNPPFTWRESADDALRMHGIGEWSDWSVPGILYRLEAYNGFGYRKKGIFTPYLWSFSNHYVKGKYVADKKYDPNAVSSQVGAAVLLKRLAAMGEFSAKPAPRPEPVPPELAGVRYDPSHVSEAARALQHWLNGHPGVALVEDGRAGRGTSDALLRITGRHLPGDPRDE